MALPQQAAITIMLLLFFGRMCASSLGLQLAYVSLAGQLSSVINRLAPAALHTALRQLVSYLHTPGACSAQLLAAQAGAAAGVPSACLAAAAASRGGLQGVGGSGAAGAAPGLPSESAHGTELCLQFQPVRCEPAALVSHYSW
jgi:hypothetical protein